MNAQTKELLALVIAASIFASIVIWIVMPQEQAMTYSYSGSQALLKNKGELEIHDQHLYYTSNDRVYDRYELNALQRLSKQYVIIIKPD